MHKTIVDPDAGDEWADFETAYSDAVVLEMPEYLRVFISGKVAEGETVGEQLRRILSEVQRDLEAIGGAVRDVVRVRIFIVSPHMTDENLESLHAIRRDFFEREHYPASTFIEVEGLVGEQHFIEVDADAVIPNDGWSVEAR